MAWSIVFLVATLTGSSLAAHMKRRHIMGGILAGLEKEAIFDGHAEAAPGQKICGSNVSVFEPDWYTVLARNVKFGDPFGTTFPQSAAPQCRCNEITESTQKLVKFSAFRKFGTKLAIKGGVCFGRFFQRHDNDVVAVVKKCNHGCGSSHGHGSLPTKEVWWTRAPTDWLISNYLYQKRGDEPLKCYMTFLRKRFDEVIAERPSQPRPQEDEHTYSDYLKRVDEADGIFMEMYRTTHENTVNTLTQLIAAALQGSKKNNMKVCLEEFMETQETYKRTWKKILDFATDHKMDSDKKLDHCLGKLNPTGGEVGHSTYKSIDHRDFARLRRIIIRFDKTWFNNTFAKAAKLIDCKELSIDARSNASTDPNARSI